MTCDPSGKRSDDLGHRHSRGFVGHLSDEESEDWDEDMDAFDLDVWLDGVGWDVDPED
tara:strand:+ start:1637 stop:1810 length:174 start_codon:yes stop_codon:yes gene_type:complete